MNQTQNPGRRQQTGNQQQGGNTDQQSGQDRGSPRHNQQRGQNRKTDPKNRPDTRDGEGYSNPDEGQTEVGPGGEQPPRGNPRERVGADTK
jgi:hypothetical protein